MAEFVPVEHDPFDADLMTRLNDATTRQNIAKMSGVNPAWLSETPNRRSATDLVGESLLPSVFSKPAETDWQQFHQIMTDVQHGKVFPNRKLPIPESIQQQQAMQNSPLLSLLSGATDAAMLAPWGAGAKLGAAMIPAARMATREASEVTAKPFFSAAERAVAESKQERAPAEQWVGMLRNAPSIKSEEMEWLGLDDWLKGQKGPVTKQQIADYVRANNVEVQEVEKGANYDAALTEAREATTAFHATQRGTPEADAAFERYRAALERVDELGSGSKTKFATYQLPGGENYRELLLTLPERGDITTVRDRDYLDPAARAEILLEGGNFTSSHWDEPNVLAHVRFNDRVIDGKKTLFIEEVQSDWHQKGRKSGYKSDMEGWTAERSGERRGAAHHKFIVRDRDGRIVNDAVIAVNERDAIEMASNKAVPDAPFKTSWPELSLKRMIRYAAEHGYDQVAWTPGEVQAARYDLSQYVKEIEYVKNGDGTYRLGIADKEGEPIRNLPGMDVNRLTLEQIEQVVGKEVANKISNGDGRRYRGHEGMTLEGLDLRVGGEGMLKFYDDMLPSAANKITKKYGTRVGQADMPVRTREGGNTTGNAIDDLVEEAGGQPVNSLGPPKAVQVHTLPITDALKDVALHKGFPLFAIGGAGAMLLPVDHDPFAGEK